MGKALCCGEQPILIAFTKIVSLAPELCGEFSHLGYSKPELCSSVVSELRDFA